MVRPPSRKQNFMSHCLALHHSPSDGTAGMLLVTKSCNLTDEMNLCRRLIRVSIALRMLQRQNGR